MGNSYWLLLLSHPQDNQRLSDNTFLKGIASHMSVCTQITCKFLFTRSLCVCMCVCMHVHTCIQLLSCVRLCDSMDCSPPGSCVHRIPQARILEWVTISSSRGSSWPRDQTFVFCNSCTGSGFFTTLPSGKRTSLYIYQVPQCWQYSWSWVHILNGKVPGFPW